jgi:hypothetical protein
MTVDKTASPGPPMARGLGLPVGTRVRLRAGSRRHGTVMPYDREYSHGAFPVRLDDGIWTRCNAGDVVVLPASQHVDQRA